MMDKTRLLAVMAVGVLGRVALADIIHVPGDFLTIQEAIDAAVNGDEVEVHPGTYNETINFLGKAIWLRSSDGAEVTTIDGTGFFHVVQCVSGEGLDTVLDGFTITGGNANGKGDDRLGGGMRNRHSSPTVTNCTFSGNLATNNGGGMANFNSSSPTVTNCTFSGNAATSQGFGQGGGMANNGSSPTVTNCTFGGNSAGVYGGGMNNGQGSNPTVTNCTFSGNTAFEGGGMRNLLDSSPTLTNCTFTGNTADGAGGGVLSVTDSNPTVTNCILWGDSPNEIVDQLGLGTTVLYSDVEGGWPGPGNINADPLFVDPLNGDLRLSPGSPCIDAGLNTAVPVGITTDLDGNPRFADDLATTDTGNGDCPIVDMGSYEFPSSCPWDLNCDGSVATADLLDLLSQWGDNPGGPPDFDGSGSVGTSDLLELLSNWGLCPEVRPFCGNGIVEEGEECDGTDDAACPGLCQPDCICGASDCCIDNDTPGCDDPKCEALICDLDPFCCSAHWDQPCANAATKLCEICQ